MSLSAAEQLEIAIDVLVNVGGFPEFQARLDEADAREVTDDDIRIIKTRGGRERKRGRTQVLRPMRMEEPGNE